MRHWLASVGSAADVVAVRPLLWVPGALGWLATVGWLTLVIGVAHPPSVGDLTIFGAAIFTSGAWPWNAIGIGLATLGLVVVAVALFALAETALAVDGGSREGTGSGRFVIGLVGLMPPAIIVGLTGIAAIAVAPDEFNNPDGAGGPLLRTALRLLPFLVALLVAFVAGGAFHAAASRALDRGASTLEAIGAAPAILRRAGIGALLTAVAQLVVRIVVVGIGAALLRVLWAPVDGRLGGGDIGAAAIGLLVGFVAIWLCLVLAGGALHAWWSLTWSRVLGASQAPVERSPQP